MGLFDRRDDVEIVRDLMSDAKESPRSVNVGQAVDLLENPNDEIRSGAATVVAVVAQEHPEIVALYPDEVVAQLSANHDEIRESAARTIQSIANERPDVAKRHVDTIEEALSDASSEVRKYALRAVSDISRKNPAAVAEYAESIAALLSEKNAICRQDAAGTLRRIAEVSPRNVKPLVPELETRLQQGTNETDETVINQCIYALSEVADEYPGAVRYSVDTVARHAESDSKKTKTNVSLVLGLVAGEHPESVKGELDRISENLTFPHDPTRKNTIVAFRRVGREYPEAIRPYADSIRDLAENDPYDAVQRNANRCLIHLEDGGSTTSAAESDTRLYDPDS